MTKPSALTKADLHRMLAEAVRNTQPQPVDPLPEPIRNDKPARKRVRSERARFLENDGGLLRAKAEFQAFECCVVEWLNQHPAPSAPGRCAWCGRPESPGAVVVPFGTEPGTHAWLHAGCWPAWYQRRREEAVLALREMGIIMDGDHDD